MQLVPLPPGCYRIGVMGGAKGFRKWLSGKDVGFYRGYTSNFFVARGGVRGVEGGVEWGVKGGVKGGVEGGVAEVEAVEEEVGAAAADVGVGGVGLEDTALAMPAVLYRF
jgi:hypothetical protein